LLRSLGACGYIVPVCQPRKRLLNGSNPQNASLLNLNLNG